jgi:hypothetical protein
MRCSHKHNFIFIRVPKTAGTSINNHLNGFGDLRSLYRHEGIPYAKIVNRSRKYIQTTTAHISSRELKAVLGQKYNNYFKFAFVRNPWDWKLSLYKYMLQNRKHPLHETCKKYKSFHDYIITAKDQYDPGYNRPRQQSDYIYSIDDKPLVDYVGRFEQLQEDFTDICQIIGLHNSKLPHHNKTKHKHYTEHYDDETREIVAKKYAKDIELFGYKFGE